MKVDRGGKSDAADNSAIRVGKVTSRDLDFVSSANAAILEENPTGGRLLLWATLLFIGAITIWAARAELDEVTKGQGRVISSRQMQVVQNLEGGILAELLVREGQVVEKGEVLLRIDDTRFASSLRENRLRHLALRAKAARLLAEAEDAAIDIPPEVIGQDPELARYERELYLARQQGFQSEIDVFHQHVRQRRLEISELEGKKKHLSRSYRLAAEELKLSAPLEKQGAISPVEILRLKRQVNDLRGEVDVTRLSILRVQSRLQEAQSKVKETSLNFRNRAREEYNEVAAELSRLSESSVALEDRLSRTAVISPLKGTVNRLMINTLGGVIQPGMELVEIVPLEDTLLVESRIRPRDIAFLRPGLSATVKFTAYDFAIYGGLQARVEHISADTIIDEHGEDYYLVRVRTDKSFLGDEQQPLPIIPGMLTEVDVLTGKKTILDYLLKPVLRARHQALVER